MRYLWIVWHLGILSWQDLKEQEIDLVPAGILGMTGLADAIRTGTGIWPWPGIFLLGVAVLTEEQIGKGDGWVVLALGMWFRAGTVEWMLLLGMCLCGITGMLLKKRELPFVPFLTAAVLVEQWIWK